MEYSFPTWYVHEEDDARLTIRETGSDRLIASLPELPDGDEEKVAALRDEARLLALTPELAFMLERFVYASEAKSEPKYADGSLYRTTKKAAYNLIDRVKGLK